VVSNNYPQITSITSEALQSQIRTLLPSQEGFGTDLMAQNVIVPIIDLTSAAEGSTVPQNLQTALAFGSQTAFEAAASTATIANTAGFWQIGAGVSLYMAGAALSAVDFDITDGISTKQLFSYSTVNNANTQGFNSFNVNMIVFLRSGDSISVTATSNAECAGSVRQIADVNGTLINPSGFNPQ